MGANALDSKRILELLKSANIHFPAERVLPLKGGANNQVYRLEFAEHPPVVLKCYFQHPQDLRPRLKAEFEFLTFAWEQGIRCIPKPLAQDPTQNMALYSHIDGSLASSIHANKTFVSSAASFLKALNQNKQAGKHLVPASEACFRAADYLETVERKLSNLQSVAHKKLQDFLNHELIPFWKQVKDTACKAALHSLDPSPEDLIITPSDFGLHNALISRTGESYFIDFEYAGWDDPAKTICDFFLQPKIPIPQMHFHAFAQQVFSLSKNSEQTTQRTQRMFPVCKVKWCCIVLNVFARAGKTRRQFANSGQNPEAQIALAKNYLFSTPMDHK